MDSRLRENDILVIHAGNAVARMTSFQIFFIIFKLPWRLYTKKVVIAVDTTPPILYNTAIFKNVMLSGFTND